jgi:MATE family multidrug resistance protein
LQIKTTDTVLLGHVSTEALSASALSDLWTMSTGVLFEGRVLGVLCGQAVGAGNPKLAGIYLQVSYVWLSVLSVLVVVAWNVTEYVWLAFGQPADLARDAGYYSRILSLSIPGRVAFSQLSQFFLSQRIFRPEVSSSIFAMSLNLVLGLFFVLGIPSLGNFHGLGFRACPWVTTAAEYGPFFFFWIVFCHYQQLHAPCWGGWSRQEITKERMWSFAKLYFPAALSVSSDFWRMGVVGWVAAKLGQVEVGIFTISYRIMWITLVMVGSLSSATSIKMGLLLGQGNWQRARQAGYVGIFVSLFIISSISCTMLHQLPFFVTIFTRDETFLAHFEATRWPFVATLFLMNFSVAIEKLLVSLGRTSEVFWMGFVASWVGTFTII